LHLYKTRNCVLQVAGSDQWGNITSGIELIRKKLGKEAYGMVMPLVTDSNGVKFGKTEGNALWLDKEKTSSYELYQYLINLEDSMIIQYLKMLTFLSKEEIEKLEVSNREHPELREAHQALAREIITDLHGEEEYKKAVELSKVLFSGDVRSLTAKEIEMVFHGVPTFSLENDINVVDLLVNNGIVTSKREARELITSGSITINGLKVESIDQMITKQDALDSKYIIVRRGKKKYYLGTF
ncbi:MAG: tyrosine--tRNA ligase, partial [Bacilli bacterium]|nr:tyrosine--tRNA ligase [Bacilli bacterium]